MKRNKFSLSNYKLLTMPMGYLIPINWLEVLPGDTMQQATSCLIRVSPLLSPVMHPVHVKIHHWYVPNRLLWEDWEDFITGGEDGTSIPVHPYRNNGTITEGDIRDYMGIPTGSYSPQLPTNVLPFRAYNLIYNEFYRDPDLINEVSISKASGQDSTTAIALRKISWEKDYFTTARPWEQKGDEVTIPLGDSAPITGIGAGATTGWSGTPTNSYETDGLGATSYASSKTGTSMYIEEDPNNSGYPNLRADLSAATGININDLRLALSIQRYQEARAQYGSRYVEYLRYLGIHPSDGRLQRPEYLGGGRQTIQFSEVLSTDGSNTGDMKGHGIAAMRTNRYRRYFEEHGIIMSFMSVCPKAIYTASLDRSFLREVKEDYFQKELQFIGEQAITNREVQCDNTNPDDVFGYQMRYDEYRQKPSTIHGEFRSSLNHWHYGREFSGDIALNSSFIEATPTDRVYASAATHPLLVMANHSIQARRILSFKGKSKTF